MLKKVNIILFNLMCVLSISCSIFYFSPTHKEISVKTPNYLMVQPKVKTIDIVREHQTASLIHF